jgi:DnaJ-class molecular chaperone
MEDYYKILGIQYNASITDISNSFNLKMIEYKCLPFLTDKDKQNIKNLKKAFFVLSNDEYKKTYDNSLKQQTNQQTKQQTNQQTNQQSTKQTNQQTNQISGIESGNYFSWTSEISSQPVTNTTNNIGTMGSSSNIGTVGSSSNISTVGSSSNTGTGTKKQLFNHSYISDRIFSLNSNNNNNTVSNSEILRPKNVGLSSDVKIEYDTPIDYN